MIRRLSPNFAQILPKVARKLCHLSKYPQNRTKKKPKWRNFASIGHTGTSIRSELGNCGLLTYRHSCLGFFHAITAIFQWTLDDVIVNQLCCETLLGLASGWSDNVSSHHGSHLHVTLGVPTSFPPLICWVHVCNYLGSSQTHHNTAAVGRFSCRSSRFWVSSECNYPSNLLLQLTMAIIYLKNSRFCLDAKARNLSVF